MTLSKAEKVGITPVYWKFKRGLPSLLCWHFVSQNSCKMRFVQRSFPVLRLILSLWQWHELVRDVDYVCTTSYYRSSSHFWKPHSASMWVSFDLVNHRKAPPVNLPLDLKDVCGFPPSHPSPQRRWGWREVIFVYVGPSAQSCFCHELSNLAGLLMCSNEKREK